MFKHLFEANHPTVMLDNFDFQSSGNHYRMIKRKVSESLFIKHNRPSWNKLESSITLKMFNYNNASLQSFYVVSLLLVFFLFFCLFYIVLFLCLIISGTFSCFDISNFSLFMCMCHLSSMFKGSLCSFFMAYFVLF